MAYHNLLSKCDRALVAYLIAQGVGTSADVNPARESDDKALPNTLCHCDSATETAPYSGTYNVSASVIVRSQAALADPNDDEDQPRIDADARTAATFDEFHRDIDTSGEQLANAITAAAAAAGIADFTMLNIDIKQISAGFDEKGSTWIDTLTLELIACPADVL